MEKYSFVERSLELVDEEPWKAPHQEVMVSYCRADELSSKCLVMGTLLTGLESSPQQADQPQRPLFASEGGA